MINRLLILLFVIFFVGCDNQEIIKLIENSKEENESYHPYSIEKGYSMDFDTMITFSLLIPRLNHDSSIAMLKFERMDSIGNFNWINATDPSFYMKDNQIILEKKMIDSLVYNKGYVVVIDEYQFKNKIDKLDINNDNYSKIFRENEVLDNQFFLVKYNY